MSQTITRITVEPCEPELGVAELNRRRALYESTPHRRLSFYTKLHTDNPGPVVGAARVVRNQDCRGRSLHGASCSLGWRTLDLVARWLANWIRLAIALALALAIRAEEIV